MSYSLRAFLNDRNIFESDGKWLYPLFELEEFIRTNRINPGDVSLEDKIAGRAAASLTAAMGIKKAYIHLISGFGLKVFQQSGVDCRYDELVEKIECRTEDLITDDMTIEEACVFLRKRAGFSKGLGIRVQNLSAGYGPNPVFENLSFTVDAGEQLIIRGEPGCGKTTLLKSMAGLIKPSAGSISLTDMKGGHVKYSSASIAYLNQNDKSMQDQVSAEQIVGMGLPSSVKTASEQAYRIELSMKRTDCFHLRKRSFQELSEGEKQRVSLAGCLAQEPGVFLIDELTSFPDYETREAFIKIIRELLMIDVPTVIIISNDDELIKTLGWRVLSFNNGMPADAADTAF